MDYLIFLKIESFFYDLVLKICVSALFEEIHFEILSSKKFEILMSSTTQISLAGIRDLKLIDAAEG